MPKRLVDGDAIWTSDKLALVEPPKFRAEYANMLPLAMANGSFECTPAKVYRLAYACNRPDVTLQDVTAILDEFERVRMLFRWTTSDGKTWGFWVGIDKPGRLPKGNEYAHAKKGENVPEKELAAFLGRPEDDRDMTGQGPQVAGPGIGSGKGLGVGLGLGVGTYSSTTSSTYSPTSPSGNSDVGDSETPKSKATEKPPEDEAEEPIEDLPLAEAVRAMITKYPRACPEGKYDDWYGIFYENILDLANEVFNRNSALAVKLVNRILNGFIKRCRENKTPNILGPAKFFSDWVSADFGVKKLRKKAAASCELTDDEEEDSPSFTLEEEETL